MAVGSARRRKHHRPAGSVENTEVSEIPPVDTELPLSVISRGARIVLRSIAIAAGETQGLSGRRIYLHMRQGGRVRPNAAACRAAHRRFKSGPWLPATNEREERKIHGRFESWDVRSEVPSVQIRPLASLPQATSQAEGLARLTGGELFACLDAFYRLFQPLPVGVCGHNTGPW